jgi:hypothetical protein
MRNRWPGRRAGFTLLEATVVSGLMAVLAVLLSTIWAGFGRPAHDVVERSRVIQEAHLAVAALARDLGGSLANSEGRLGGKEQYRFVGWMCPAESQFWLCFDGGAAPDGVADWGLPDTVLVYMQEGDRLVRWDCHANTTFTVARYLNHLEVHASGDDLQIQLTFTYRDFSRTYVLLARLP